MLGIWVSSGVAKKMCRLIPSSVCLSAVIAWLPASAAVGAAGRWGAVGGRTGAAALVFALLLSPVLDAHAPAADAFDREAEELFAETLAQYRAWDLEAATPDAAAASPAAAPNDAWLRDADSIIRAFRNVATLYPQHALADNALYWLGRAQLARYRAQKGAADLEEARVAFAQVAVSYPDSELADEALFYLGYLNENLLGDSTAAISEFRALLARYDGSELAPFARQHLARLEGSEPPSPPASGAVVETTGAPDLLFAEPPTPESESTARAAGSRGGRRHGAPPTVTDLRFRSTKQYTRIVIDVTDRIEVRTAQLTSPDRIYFDLLGTRVDVALHNRSFPVGDGLLRAVRIAQNQPEVSRVVLDFETIGRYRMFPLNDPYRLVIDVFGAGSAMAEPTPAPDEAGTADPSRLARVLQVGIGRIVIDPGHGGKDPGATGPSGVREKDIVLDVGLRLRDLLKAQLDCEIIMTRDTDRFIPLEERTAIANSGADLFVSIHANASRRKAARGVETYYLNLTTDPGALETAARENATSSARMKDLGDILKKLIRASKIAESRELAQHLQTSMIDGLRRERRNVPDLGVKKAPFYVLIGSEVPSALAEIAFVTNREEERLLGTATYRTNIAKNLYEGIARYMRSLGTPAITAK
ncbi:MAG: N-acetylmuramoyl-L-alanine amidase [Candidatus Schekmanbacteria bacterium]|nr:N-acetylmuramoyl-L-alanine amidase [Candidatus Schekmanbacteria bacterium]